MAELDRQQPVEIGTRPLVFDGRQLSLNMSTSAAGGIRVEIQDESGQPLPGYSLADSVELYGNSLERVVRWRDQADLSASAGRVVRRRFVMSDADLYSFQFC